MFPIPQLNQVQHGGAVQERLSTQQRHQLAQKCLTQVVQYKTQEISAQLCILWCSANVFQGCLKRNSFQMPCSPATSKSNTTKWQVWLDKLWWTVILCEICRERSLNETSEKARFEAVPPWFLRSDLTTWIRQATKIASPLARLRTEQCVIVIFFFFRQQRFSLNLLNRHYWELFVYSMASPRFLLFALHPVGWRTTHSRWTAADQQSNETITW